MVLKSSFFGQGYVFFDLRNFLTLNSLTKKVLTDNMGKRWFWHSEEMMKIISVAHGQTGFIAFEIHSLTLDGGEEFKKTIPNVV